jgi:uncharacterized repeat protein (TIGR03803 family)
MRASSWPPSRECGSLQLLATVFLLCAAMATASPAQTLTTLHDFAGQPNDGRKPYAGLVQGTDGNFYGTTYYGGANDKGTVFKITPDGTVTTLYSFACSGSSGCCPYGGLVQGADGNFYGTTSQGGPGSNNAGAVFKITPSGTLTTLHNFCTQNNCDDGYDAYGTLIQATDGNFYGTTSQGGTHQENGTVFKITPSGTLTTLHSFDGTDGAYPTAGLIEGSDGNFYGTTRDGGTDGYHYGTVFKITANGTFTLLHTFEGSDGGDPYARLIQATDGNFYGTTTTAGAHSAGTVFKITSGGTLTTLYNFCAGGYPCADGEAPYAALVQADGNFYGTTEIGGANNDGTIFEITPSGTLTTLHSFAVSDGAMPYGGVIQATDGNFYGTTYTGGANDDGTVFKLTPVVSTTTVLVTAPNPSYLGEAVNMTATVTAQDGSTPTGTVVFDSNGVQIGSAQLNNSGVAVLIYSSLPLGTESLTAVYQGSGNFAPSTSSTILQVVGGTVTSVTSIPNPSTVGQVVNITATVSPGALGGPTPTGTVSFTSNGTVISGCSSVTLNSGVAMCTTSSLALGTDVIVATYSGDSDYLPSSGTLIQIVNPVPTPIEFVPVTPCRIVDTRNPDGPFGGPPISGGTSRPFPLSQSGNPCNIPSTAVAYSLNVTVVPQGRLGYLTIWPTGEGQPVVSTMNSHDGRVKANAAVVPAGTPSGSVSVYVTDTSNVILDIDGYFAAPASGSLQFYALTPCRIVDTRNNQDGGSLQAGVERDYTIPPTCGVPRSAAAYSFNVTVVPTYGALDYLTVWPQGEPRPTVSTLNNNTGTVVANAAIVPAGSQNATAFYAHNNETDLLLDIDGYFAAPGPGGLSLYTLTPCRVLDTRQNNGQPFMGKKTVNVEGSFCAPPGSAKAYVFNATVVPPGRMPYLTLWPDGEMQPNVSTLNADDGFITSNMAIVPTTNGSIDAYAAALTQLILDISGYFAP